MSDFDKKNLGEWRELANAEGLDDVIHETADVMYFALVALARAGGRLADVERELLRRARKLTRRPGDAKPANSPANSKKPVNATSDTEMGNRDPS